MLHFVQHGTDKFFISSLAIAIVKHTLGVRIPVSYQHFSGYRKPPYNHLPVGQDSHPAIFYGFAKDIDYTNTFSIRLRKATRLAINISAVLLKRNETAIFKV